MMCISSASEANPNQNDSWTQDWQVPQLITDGGLELRASPEQNSSWRTAGADTMMMCISSAINLRHDQNDSWSKYENAHPEAFAKPEDTPTFVDTYVDSMMNNKMYDSM